MTRIVKMIGGPFDGEECDVDDDVDDELWCATAVGEPYMESENTLRIPTRTDLYRRSGDLEYTFVRSEVSP